MDEKELRKALEIHLDTLRRNLEVVSLLSLIHISEPTRPY